MLETSIICSQNVLYSIKEKLHNLSHYEIIICKCFRPGIRSLFRLRSEILLYGGNNIFEIVVQNIAASVMHCITNLSCFSVYAKSVESVLGQRRSTQTLSSFSSTDMMAPITRGIYIAGSFGLYQEENATDRRDWNRKANRTNFRN